jgi:DNA-binding MarR family transcriptional regulator
MKGQTILRRGVVHALTSLASSINEVDILASRVCKKLTEAENFVKRDTADISLTECHFLDVLAGTESINGTLLAERLGMTKGGVSKMAARLLKMGLIEAKRIGGNQKTRYYTLTNEGERISLVHQKLHSVAERSLWNYLKSYSAEDIHKFVDMLLGISAELARTSAHISQNTAKYLKT